MEGENTSPTTIATSNNNNNNKSTNDRAKARWSILRNALLQKAQSSADSTSAATSTSTTTCSTPSLQHSIHRFPGYQLLERHPAGSNNGSKISWLPKQLRWDAKTSHENQSRLSIACLGVAAVSPKGQCVDIVDCPPLRVWLETLKELCGPSVSLLLVEDKNPAAVTLLVQERSSTTTKYSVYEYVLDSCCSIWTREPREKCRLSLADLVSHRQTGVDNTGNICVWDSERTLAHLLYHYYSDFHSLAQSSSPPRRILELGTGMAGLAAIALGLRLVQREPTDSQSETVQVTLTDGHPGGVLNNQINQTLTKQWSSFKDIEHPYHSLNVSEQLLLWTTDLEEKSSPIILSSSQDVVLVSDCTHFQEFHAALAITALRSLRVGGVAIFCQPTRGDSLNNFVALLTEKTTSSSSIADLVALEWWEHAVLREQDALAREKYPAVYDANLHCPKILLVQKLKELTGEDCQNFVHHQKTRQTVKE
jgi:hypothetical protein